ncbi:heme-binding domain-containing protein [Marivirga atlantica]|jgi:hypothetical protein|uniref:Heme-binding domain-containing protein n=1 Tax=Marivirga atlantica TaxID=1548457 RepID=A0A937DKH1_9BACT|nr:heme-binding domain-containing protein [Marivirga atlantica]MBL0766925.1 heme-binding domain-containing protein [Marivirga atlantica]
MKKAAIIILILGIGIQFIPVPKNQSDEVSKTDFLQTVEAPFNIQQMIKASCYDCHSNNTNYPWYGRVRPFAWLLQQHIDEGKDELNFSTFQEYSGRMQREKIRSMISQISDGEMPLKEYLWMHPEAELTNDEKEQLIKYLETLNP